MAGAVATAVVNATAPSPQIRLRIVDGDGKDVSGVKLGDELYLRLDLDDDSKFFFLIHCEDFKSDHNIKK